MNEERKGNPLPRTTQNVGIFTIEYLSKLRTRPMIDMRALNVSNFLKCLERKQTLRNCKDDAKKILKRFFGKETKRKDLNDFHEKSIKP